MRNEKEDESFGQRYVQLTKVNKFETDIAI